MNKTVLLAQAAALSAQPSVGADLVTLHASRNAIIHRVKRNCSDFKENLECSMSKRRTCYDAEVRWIYDHALSRPECFIDSMKYVPCSLSFKHTAKYNDVLYFHSYNTKIHITKFGVLLPVSE